MFCSHCGANVNDDAAFCPKCGAPLKSQEVHYVNHSQQPQPQPKPQQESGLTTAAKVFMVIACVTTGLSIIGIFCLIWMVPLTVVYFGKVKRGEKISIGFTTFLSPMIDVLTTLLSPT